MKEDLRLICEEIEEGVVEGCSPWPWDPCVYPPGNMKRTYKITRLWYAPQESEVCYPKGFREIEKKNLYLPK